MDNNTYARWIEVQAWYICQTILKKHNNIMELMNIVDCLASYGEYPAEPVKVIVNEIITSRRYAPTEEERIILMYLAKIPVNTIKKLTRKSGKSLYNIINTHAQDNRAFYPRLIQEQTIILNKFLDAIKALKELSIC